jgi:phenolic acid decarboxylase
MISILDNRLEARPACDKIIHNSSDVTYPYFRADSFIGSLYIQDTGLYNIQIISEKIVQKDIRKGESSASENSKLLSVFLTPITR